MLEMTFQLMYLGSPLILAASIHGFCIKYDWLNKLIIPIDLGLSFRGKRVFGDNKTWKVFLLNIVFCTVGSIIQAWIQNKNYFPEWIFLVDYQSYSFLLGIMLGLGMTFGELTNSFIKRQSGIPPGERKKGLLGVIFFLFDQVDITIGIWVFLYLIIRPPTLLILWSIFLTIVTHIVISTMGYLLGLRKTIA